MVRWLMVVSLVLGCDSGGGLVDGGADGGRGDGALDGGADADRPDRDVAPDGESSPTPACRKALGPASTAG
ncbi:MAG: hypothetical protein R3F60_03385 [bacterium]